MKPFNFFLLLLQIARANHAQAQQPNHEALETPEFASGNLPVPHATLHYETIGTGPLLLFISGANGDANIWHPIARILASNFTVAMYDRRGFSRSLLSLTEAQDYDNRLATDADDARLLIQHLSPGVPAYVLGTSSGAIVALELLALYPDVLKTVVSHEAPALSVLPDREEQFETQRAIYAAWRKGGAPPALVQFAKAYRSDGADIAGVVGMLESFANLMYWFERELLPYPLHEFDLAELGKNKDLLMLANGDATDPTAPHLRANTVLGEEFGIGVETFPGGHVEYAIDPLGFAWALVGALAKKNG